MLGANFSKSNNFGRHFCLHFQVVCPDLQVFCEHLHRFFPDFQQIKSFGGALAAQPPTPLAQRLSVCTACNTGLILCILDSPSRSSPHRALGKKATAPNFKVLIG